ncbi:hypothetical protein J6590_067944 [Homalodisca vitripennis]|nr:hypothetical protein J6590_067944 [Homalodisca vitripennis]
MARSTLPGSLDLEKWIDSVAGKASRLNTLGLFLWGHLKSILKHIPLLTLRLDCASVTKQQTELILHYFPLSPPSSFFSRNTCSIPTFLSCRFCDGNARAAQREYQARYPDLRLPSPPLEASDSEVPFCFALTSNDAVYSFNLERRIIRCSLIEGSYHVISVYSSQSVFKSLRDRVNEQYKFSCTTYIAGSYHVISVYSSQSVFKSLRDRVNEQYKFSCTTYIAVSYHVISVYSSQSVFKSLRDRVNEQYKFSCTTYIAGSYHVISVYSSQSGFKSPRDRVNEQYKFSCTTYIAM